MKITSVDSMYYHIHTNEYNGMGRNLLNLKVGDDIEMSGWSDRTQTYNKVTVNGIDRTKDYNTASQNNRAALTQWANNRRKELINQVKS